MAFLWEELANWLYTLYVDYVASQCSDQGYNVVYVVTVLVIDYVDYVD